MRSKLTQTHTHEKINSQQQECVIFTTTNESHKNNNPDGTERI